MIQSTMGSSPARFAAPIVGHIRNNAFKSLASGLAGIARAAAVTLVVLAFSVFSGSTAAQTPSMLNEPATQIAAGGGHTCAVTTGGGVQCWGYNGLGQLGNPTNVFTTIPNPRPLPVVGLAGVVAISGGGDHVCALTTVGAVKCWGYNEYGQLGDNSIINRSSPVDVVGLSSGVIAIAAGGRHTCALTTSGLVKCWGYNGVGTLGNGSNSHSSIPVNVTNLGSGVAAITAGNAHTCAVTTAGGLKCWGYNNTGELGDNSVTNRSTPVAVTGLDSGVAAVRAGLDHTCALSTAGAVKCWGYNFWGQLGDGSNTQRLTPVNVSGLGSGVAAISAGGRHTCAVMTGGGLKCWGFNDSGQLGDSSNTQRSTPVNVTNLGSGVAAVSGGLYFTCALTTVGAVKCWGINNYGQLGDGSTNNRSQAVEVTGFASGVAAVSAGASHTCALSTTGGVTCWGYNIFGQLGNGSSTNSAVPVAVSGLDSGVAAISAGRLHTCAVTSAGEVKCWGLNAQGQLGDNSTTNRSTPVTVSGLAVGGATVEAGGFHTCVVTVAGPTTSPGGVRCWGNNSYGQLGDSTTTSRLTPVNVTGLPDSVSAVSAGDLHSCMVDNIGQVKCWGSNSNGQIGDNSTTNRSAPVSLGNGISAITAGDLHTCAQGGGAVLCWGSNAYGQIGDNSTTQRLAPVATIFSGIAAVSAALNHTCALTNAGGVRCWGNNDYGQLGDNSVTQRLAPVSVASLNGVATAISAGGTHTCAVTTIGGLTCWGDNTSGQLGDNSLSNRLTPVAIRSGQSISFAPPATAASGAVLTLTASTSNGLTVVFDTWTPDTCSVSGGTTLNITGAPGSLCGVRASQIGAAPLAAGGSVAPAPQQLRVIQIPQVVSSTGVSSNLNPSVFGANVTLTAQVTGSTSPLPGGTITFVDGATVLGTVPLSGSASAIYSSATWTVGPHNVTATYSGDATNATSTGTVAQVVNKANQVIVFGSAPSVSVGGGGTVSASGGASGNAVTFTTNTPAICSLSGATVTGQATGTCTVAADQLGNGNYNAAAQQTQSFNVTAPLPVLDIDDSAPATQYDAASDGVLLIRYLLGYRDNALTTDAISISARRNATQIAAHIAINLTRFDVDGDGKTLATTDGVMILRRLLGITSAAAIAQGVKGSNRTDADVVLAIDALKP